MTTDLFATPGTDHNWSESFYFNFYDQKTNICGFMRLGLTPNKKTKNMFCFLMMPNGKHYGMRQEIPYTKTLDVPPLTLSKTGEKQWSLTYSGPMNALEDTVEDPFETVHFDLEFDAKNTLFNYRDCSLTAEQEEMSNKVASEHFEQYGTVKGMLTIDETSYTIDALGERDHSYGVRDWTAPKQWIWLTCQCNEDIAFNITKLTVEQGDIDCGFIHMHNQNIPLIDVDIATEYDDAGRPLRFTLHMTTKDKETYTATAKTIDHITVPFITPATGEHSNMYENLAEYSFENYIGYGIAEYLIKK